MQPYTGGVEVVAAYVGVWCRGSVLPDVRYFICASCAGSPVVWVGDVRYVPAHWEYLRRLTPQGGPHSDGAEIVDRYWMGCGCTPQL